MKKLVQKILAAYIGLTAFSAQASVLSTEELRVLQKKMKSASQLSVDFSQIKSVAIRPNQKSHSFGKAIFAKPAKFRWRIIKPKADSLIFDGESLYSLQEDKKTATVFTAKAERAHEIREVIDLVLDFDALLTRYDIVESLKEGSKVKLALKPKKKGALTALNIRMDAATASVEYVKMSFLNKNTSEFEFSNPDRSIVPLDTFAVPKEYKIVKGM